MTSQTLTSHALDHRSSLSSLVRPLLATDQGIHQGVLRLTLALTMFPHGAQKALGWFGGYGWEGTMGFLTGQIGMPSLLAAGMILFEFLGPLLLVVGLGTRPVAAGFAAIMIGAIATVHAQFGFFMNWSGAQAGEGFEFHLLVIGVALALVIAGGGRWSIDGRLRAKDHGQLAD